MTLYRVIVHGRAPWGSWSHVHWSSSSLAPAAVADIAYTAARGAWLDTAGGFQGLQDLYPASTELHSVEVYPVGNSPRKMGPSVIRRIFDARGRATGVALPPGVAVCGLWRSARAGAAGRGRTYLPPPVVSFVTATGQMAPGCGDRALAGLAQLANVMRAGGCPIGSPLFSGTPTVIRWTSISTDDTWDSQRPRAHEVGTDRFTVTLT